MLTIYYYIYYFMCLAILLECLSVCLSAHHACAFSLEALLKLQMLVNCHVGVGNQTWVL